MKYLLILIMTLPFGASAQQNRLTFTIPVADITTDTSIAFSISENQKWSMQINSVSLTGTLDGAVELENSNDGVNFNTLAGFTTYNLTSADTSSSFESATFTHRVFRFTITKNLLTGGSLVFIFNGKPSNP